MRACDIRLERKQVICALTGSHNYNLDTPESDQDYKIFTFPSFDDIYYHDYYTVSNISADFDYTAHDIRRLPLFLRKSNLNFLEILFSQDLVFFHPYDQSLQHRLTVVREDIAAMNLVGMYDACYGTHIQKHSKMLRGTSTTQQLVDAFGYDTKQAQHCYRNLDFLERYHATDFKSFAQAIYYDDGPERDMMLAIKAGEYTLLEFEALLQEKQVKVRALQENYMASYFVERTNTLVEDLIKEVVREHILIL